MEGSVVLMKKYRLLDKVGSGSFGSIYSCTRTPRQASTSTPGAASPSNWYSRPNPGEERQGRRTAPVRDQALPALSGHQYRPSYAAGISRLIDYGTDAEHDRIFLVIELFDRSLEELFQLW
jgi:serine/threonine protein kinase